MNLDQFPFDSRERSSIDRFESFGQFPLDRFDSIERRLEGDGARGGVVATRSCVCVCVRRRGVRRHDDRARRWEAARHHWRCLDRFDLISRPFRGCSDVQVHGRNVGPLGRDAKPRGAKRHIAHRFVDFPAERRVRIPPPPPPLPLPRRPDPSMTSLRGTSGGVPRRDARADTTTAMCFVTLMSR